MSGEGEREERKGREGEREERGGRREREGWRAILPLLYQLTRVSV